MQGTITTYLPEKKYGFIKGDDGKDYFFHADEFSDNSQIKNICEEAHVTFEQQATPKGYKAKKCSLVSLETIKTYIVPEQVLTSKTDTIKGWEITDYSDWNIIGTSNDSPDAARKDLHSRAISVDSNCLINVEYFKTKGSSGNYEFTIHNYKGRAVVAAKKNANGILTLDMLKGVNNKIAKLNEKFLIKKKEDEIQAKKTNTTVTIASIFIFIVFSISAPVLSLLFVIAIVVFMVKYNSKFDPFRMHESWLEPIQENNTTQHNI